MAQQEQESQSQRKGPPAGWRYPAQAKRRSRVGGLIAQVSKVARNNAPLVTLLGVLVPLFGVLLTSLVTTVLAQREQARQQEIQSAEAKQQQELEEQRAQETALQTYLGDIGNLILSPRHPLREAAGKGEVSRLARAKTLTVLLGLDGERKRILLQFLNEEKLIDTPNPIVSLSGADLSYAKLSGIDKEHNQFSLPETHLVGVNLYKAKMRYSVLDGSNLNNSTLTQAVVTFASLSNATFSNAFMDDIHLTNSNLSDADLANADLSEADLSEANLSRADLSEARLSGAYLSGAYLSRADLSDAYLKGARGVTKEQLDQALSLEGAMMPDGSIHD
jgi:uncharacterized protein YjbI with pentapeptide repeats